MANGRGAFRKQMFGGEACNHSSGSECDPLRQRRHERYLSDWDDSEIWLNVASHNSEVAEKKLLFSGSTEIDARRDQF
ncbi:hypothetical protein SBC1_27000 [Caballeronia sp. SBC1]|nr:hypothetical protein SBC1_27000 [Caballeronia sp. SBC1]